MNTATKNAATVPTQFDMVSILAPTRPTTRVPAMPQPTATERLANRVEKLAHDIRAGRLEAGTLIRMMSIVSETYGR